MNLSTKLSQIKGVGVKTAESFAVAGLHNVGDLISFFPRKHEDFSNIVPISEVKPGKQTVRGKVVKTEIKRVRRGMTVSSATIEDLTGRLQAVWFNQPYRVTQFTEGKEYFFSGDFEFRYNRYQLTNPSAEKVSDLPVQTDRILPIYRSVKGLKSQIVRKILVELKPLMTFLPETLPDSVIKQQDLLGYADAVTGLHFPKSPEDIKKARARLAFEEIFQLLLASQLNKRENAALKGLSIAFDKTTVKEFVSSLPFKLTSAQRLAAWEIIQDMERKTPMNRLLQGDVGSGKTVVAGLAAFSSAKAGFQTAFMAPTEVLARQHAETLDTLLGPFGTSVALLTGSVKSKSRTLIKNKIADGDVDIIVGTHALIQDSVSFKSLGLVVIDEQHRFGVNQRQKLLSKSEIMPHLLSMTATPIPRSLQLTLFGELDIGILNERPASRKPIKTEIVSPVSASKVYGIIDGQIESGRQAYVICGLITDSELSDKKSVETEYKKLKNSVFGHRKIGLLHGKMKSEEKERVMADFKSKKFDILVSTTVVEVGVDVANASVIMIENADQFGLAQLHQLRGRVGRSEHQSYCYLMTSDSKKPIQRLKEMEKSNDGFYLAEVDLALRGPGEVYGRAQHGQLNLKIATLADTRLIKDAQKAVTDFLSSGEDLLQYKQLFDKVERYQRMTTLN